MGGGGDDGSVSHRRGSGGFDVGNAELVAVLVGSLTEQAVHGEQTLLFLIRHRHQWNSGRGGGVTPLHTPFSAPFITNISQTLNPKQRIVGHCSSYLEVCGSNSITAAGAKEQSVFNKSQRKTINTTLHNLAVAGCCKTVQHLRCKINGSVSISHSIKTSPHGV